MEYHPFPFENLGSFAFDLCECPQFPKIEKNSNGSNGSGSLMVINGTCNVA
jgi:hypothetical protein